MRVLLRSLVVVAVLVTAVSFGILPHFFSARRAPGALEETIVRRLRRLSIPAAERALANPLPVSDEVLSDARAHFADHCAFCHGQDGRGNASLGATLYPPVPDLTAPVIQSLSDGEIFYAIQNGIRFSGMPAWGSDDSAHASSSWALVHFIRRLAELSGADLRQRKEPRPPSTSGQAAGASLREGSHRHAESEGHSHGH